MAAVTICSDFGAPQNKVWPCFHCFPICFPWSDGKKREKTGSWNWAAQRGGLPAFVVIVVVQSLSHVQLFVIPWTAAQQASLSFTISRSLLKLMSIESSMLSNRFILCCLLLLLLSVFPSIRGFGHLMRRWPKYWNFSFNISPPNEYSGFISFRIDWFDLPAVQGTLESSLQSNSHICT